jgi:DNA-directed RNA polymerase specialized sigma24 family protein
VTGDDCEGEPMNERDVLAERFSAERTRLRAVAYQMLGSLAEAEDAVQEARLRLARSDEAAIDNLSGWLITVVGRVCLDMLRARTARREDADGRLPDPVVTYGDDSAPEADADADAGVRGWPDKRLRGLTQMLCSSGWSRRASDSAIKASPSAAERLLLTCRR